MQYYQNERPHLYSNTNVIHRIVLFHKLLASYMSRYLGCISNLIVSADDTTDEICKSFKAPERVMFSALISLAASAFSSFNSSVGFSLCFQALFHLLHQLLM